MEDNLNKIKMEDNLKKEDELKKNRRPPQKKIN